MASVYFNGAAGSAEWTDTIQDKQSGAIIATNFTGVSFPSTGTDVELGPGSPYATITINATQYQHTSTPIGAHTLKIDSGIC